MRADRRRSLDPGHGYPLGEAAIPSFLSGSPPPPRRQRGDSRASGKTACCSRKLELVMSAAMFPVLEDGTTLTMAAYLAEWLAVVPTKVVDRREPPCTVWG